MEEESAKVQSPLPEVTIIQCDIEENAAVTVLLSFVPHAYLIKFDHACIYMLCKSYPVYACTQWLILLMS